MDELPTPHPASIPHDPRTLLADAFQRANAHLDESLIADAAIRDALSLIAHNLRNRAGTRFLLACLLAKFHRPEVDIRKPYTEIGGTDTYSGRTYDERYVAELVQQHQLPCNDTTAFLTPAFRNHNRTLTRGTVLVGNPPALYKALVDLLNDVHEGHVRPDDALSELLRLLILYRREKARRRASLLEALRTTEGSLPLSTEQIITLISQHLTLPKTSRLPVLLITAAYQVAARRLQERVLALQAHQAADVQTGALGDIDITLEEETRVVTSYEIKDRPILKDDIERALHKLAHYPWRVDNYLFVTTHPVAKDVAAYAQSLYVQTDGTDFALLDCIEFMRHFLHIFHRIRQDFLQRYQELLLEEPPSAVSDEVKEAFLTMRQAAEAGTAL